MEKSPKNSQDAFRAANDPAQVSGKMVTVMSGQEPRKGEKPPRFSRSDGAEAGIVRGIVYPDYRLKRDA